MTVYSVIQADSARNACSSAKCFSRAADGETQAVVQQRMGTVQVLDQDIAPSVWHARCWRIGDTGENEVRVAGKRSAARQAFAVPQTERYGRCGIAGGLLVEHIDMLQYLLGCMLSSAH